MAVVGVVTLRLRLDC